MMRRLRVSRKVVLFFPAFSSQEATAPLSLLAISTPLLRAGYTVTLVDSTITPDFKKRVLKEVQDALFLGISLVTGPTRPRWKAAFDPSTAPAYDTANILIEGSGSFIAGLAMARRNMIDCVFSFKNAILETNLMDPLEIATIGNTGLQVTRLGMGSAPLGGLFQDVPEEQALATV